MTDTSKSNRKHQLDNIEVSSKKSAAGQSQGTSKATSRASKRREVEQLEREKLKAKQEAEHRLREREMQLKNERDKIELILILDLVFPSHVCIFMKVKKCLVSLSETLRLVWV